MKIAEAINRVNAIKHNTYSNVPKIQWLSELDLKIYKDIITTHVQKEPVEFHGYPDDISTDTPLLIEEYDEMYVKWLEAQINQANGEMERYNNCVTQFNDAYKEFRNFYNRTHAPLSKGQYVGM